MNMDIPPKPSGQEEPREYPPITIGDREINIHMCVAKLKEGPKDFEQIAADIFDYCMVLLKIPEGLLSDETENSWIKNDLSKKLSDLSRRKFINTFWFNIPNTGTLPRISITMSREKQKVETIYITFVSSIDSFKENFPDTDICYLDPNIRTKV
jgi:hypothetical protein